MLFYTLALVVGTLHSAQAATPQMIYAVAEQDGQVLVYVNSLAHWITEHSLTDGYSEAETPVVEAFTEAAGLCNAMESTYELCHDESITAADLQKRLARLSPHVRFDSDFQSFMELETAPGFEFQGRTYQAYTAVFKLVASLYTEFGTPVDLLGQADFGDAERERMKEILFPESSFYNDAARAVIRTMAEAKFFSFQSGETRLFQGTVPHLDDREIQKHIEEAIIDVINEGAQSPNDDSDLL